MKKDPRLMTDEEKLAGLEESGRIQGPGTKPKEDETPPETTPERKEETPTPPAAPAPEKKDTPTPAPETPTTVDDDKKDQQLPPEGTTPDPSTISTEQKKRNVRHIPIAQFQETKKTLKEKETELAAANTRIKELEALSQKPAGAPATKDAVKKFAEKYSFDEADVEELLAAATPGSQIPEDLVETMQSMQREKADKQEQEYFEKEWTPIEAQLRAKYPGATADQLKQVRDLVNEAAHTEAFIDKELGYVLYKQDGDISKLLGEAATPSEPAPAGKKTVESSRPAGSKVGLSAADFKGRKTFEEFNQMDPSDVKSIIKEMDPNTYRSFTAWASNADNQGGLVVTRNGQKVVLK